MRTNCAVICTDHGGGAEPWEGVIKEKDEVEGTFINYSAPLSDAFVLVSVARSVNFSPPYVDYQKKKKENNPALKV